MNRYLVTNPRYTGNAELLYRNGVLAKIDVSDTDMTAEVISHFKRSVAALEANLKAGFTSDTIIVPAEFEATFDMFWQAYDKKINRKRAEALWNKLPKTKQVLAWDGVKLYDKYLKYNNWRGKADPETYLRNEMWENEYK